MYAYLNYYKKIEMHEGDNPLVGIILCASKNEKPSKVCDLRFTAASICV